MKRKAAFALLVSSMLLVSNAVLSAETDIYSGNVFSLCNDYSLSALSLELSPEIGEVASGQDILVRGFIKNNSSYPIVNGDVLIKIYRLSAGEPTTMIDRFILPLDISLLSGKTYAFSFPWRVPRSIMNGDYAMTGSFVSGSKFDFAIPALTDTVNTSSAYLKITSPVSGEVYFDRENIKGNDVSLREGLIFSPDENIRIETILKSSLTEDSTVLVKWKVYGGSTLGETSVIDSGLESLNLPASGNKSIPVIIKDTNFAEYHVVLEAKQADSKSILIVSVARANVPNMTLRFVGTDGARVFGCVSSTFPSEFKRTVNVSLIDGQNNNIFRESFDIGTSTSAGFSKAISPVNFDEVFSLRAEVRDEDDEILDQAVLIYDCRKTENVSCKEDIASRNGVDDLKLMYIGITAVSLCGLWLILRRARGKKSISNFNV